MAKKTFIGFSTRGERSGRRSWVLSDIELIKQDLYNHFYTRIGERVHRAEFGSRLWEYIMEQNTDSMKGAIQAECERVVRLDSRLDVRNVVVTDYGNGVTVSMELYYRPFKSVEIFTLDFDRRQGNK